MDITSTQPASYRVHTFTLLMKAVELICTVCGEEGELKTLEENSVIWNVLPVVVGLVTPGRGTVGGGELIKRSGQQKKGNGEERYRRRAM